MLGIEAQRYGERRPHVREHSTREPLPGGRTKSEAEPGAADDGGRGEGGHQAGASSRRSRSSDACALRRRISSRSPGNTRRTARVSVWTRAASHTVPTGFSGVPPPGPAIPVTAMLASAEKSRWAPSAIARTVSSETAPWAWSVSSGTLSAAVLMTSAYATTPPMNVSDAPATSVIRFATRPPVHDTFIGGVVAYADV